MLRKRSCFLQRIASAVIELCAEVLRFLTSSLRSRTALVAENLFLRKQLAFYVERKVQPRRLDDAAQFHLAFWSRLFDWKDALLIVKPDTLIRWHRMGFKLFWKCKSQAGRPMLPGNIRSLIARMVRENPTWGQARIAAELSVKPGIRVSPRTVRAYWPADANHPGPRRISSHHWKTFVRNHAQAIVACDFPMAITAEFRILYVFVAIEVGSRRILHFNVTAHPTADWTLQQFREAIPGDHSYRFLIHDRDSIFSADVDGAFTAFELKVLRTPLRAPKANAYCERLVGTIRRDCLDFMIPFGEKHLRRILREWVSHYNHGRPHLALGPGIPAPSQAPCPSFSRDTRRHSLPESTRVASRSILGGLHHEYHLESIAA
jgi:transposase InsO family protein